MDGFFVGDYALVTNANVKKLFLFAYVDCALALTSMSGLNLKEVKLDVKKYLNTFTSADSALVRAVMLLPSLKIKRDMLALEAKKTARVAEKAAKAAKRRSEEARGSGAADASDEDLSDDDMEVVEGSKETVTTEGTKKKPGQKRGQISIDKEWNTFERYWKLERELRLTHSGVVAAEQEGLGDEDQEGSDNQDEVGSGDDEDVNQVAAVVDGDDPRHSTMDQIESWYNAAVEEILARGNKKDENSIPDEVTVRNAPKPKREKVFIDKAFLDGVIGQAEWV